MVNQTVSDTILFPKKQQQTTLNVKQIASKSRLWLYQFKNVEVIIIFL